MKQFVTDFVIAIFKIDQTSVVVTIVLGGDLAVDCMVPFLGLATAVKMLAYPSFK